MRMSARMAELALKKRMLRQRSAVLRHAFALQVDARVAPLAGLADRAVSTGRWVGRHPYWVVAAAVALAVWRPKGVVRLAGRGLWVWQTWQRLQPVVLPLLAQFNGVANSSANRSINSAKDGSPMNPKDQDSTKA